MSQENLGLESAFHVDPGPDIKENEFAETKVQT